MIYNMTMIRVNVHDAKTHFSKYLEAAEKGETVVVCRRNVPIAEIRAVQSRRRRPPLSKPTDGFHVPASFFDELPDDILRAFYGEDE
jgi:prevent-host-death family protein